mmetsp:Transcript_24669/g.72339  ORF Transcript_24669/g.72339 Transcript_24669/m.72339 type:complete len:179 (-) Transcript_24669:23-559(-)
MACSRCPTRDFCLGLFALLPWIVVHCWYGAALESVTSLKKAGNSEETTQLIVGLVAITALTLVLIYYTKRMLEDMVREAQTQQRQQEEEEVGEAMENIVVETGEDSPRRSNFFRTEDPEDRRGRGSASGDGDEGEATSPLARGDALTLTVRNDADGPLSTVSRRERDHSHGRMASLES